jgi:hypothetical protein
MHKLVLPALAALVFASVTSATAQERRSGPMAQAPRSAGPTLSRPARVDRAIHSSGRFAYRSRSVRGQRFGYRPYYSAYYGYTPAYYRAYPYRSTYYRSYSFAPAAYRSGDYCDW